MRRMALPDTRRGFLSVGALRRAADAGELDTVMLAAPDMQGRLQGKRLDVRHFLDEVLEHDAEGCAYQLAVDVEMNTVGGYAHASWETGYGDFVYAPDLATLRRIPWLDGTALVMCDLRWEDGSPVEVAPRRLLRAQIERLMQRGLTPFAGTELELIVFRDSYAQAWQRGYRDLTPGTRYNVDYSLLDTDGLEPMLGRVRRSMRDAGLVVESSKGECNLGQYEINFRYQDALRTADEHVIYKNGAKEIAAQHGHAITFMAKYDAREGNSCHVHMSLRDAEGRPVMAEGDVLSPLGRHFVAGLLHGLRELTLLFAPNVNSYKRYVRGSFAPTVLAWGRDNRTCALRLVGREGSLRIENRLPGGDVNPYLALAAMIAAGLHGIEKELPLEEAFSGDAYASEKPRVAASLREAQQLFAASPLARAAFGEGVVEHYVHMAQVELEAFEAAVTDWERFRGFERL